MKKLKFIWAGCLLASAISMASASAYAENEGHERGNGGDEYAKDFIQMGLDVWNTLDRMPISGVDNDALLRAIQLTKVVSKPTLTLDGNEVDAINYPDPEPPRIEVSRAGWDRMAPSPHRRAFLVLHEYLGILRVDDSQFRISLQLDGARACPRNAAVRAELERRIHKYCYDITKDDLHFVGEYFSFGFARTFPAAELSLWDFAGLESVTRMVFSRQVPVSVVRTSAFDFVPGLIEVNELYADEIELLHPHANLQTLDLWGHAVGAIADGAFKNLSGLTDLRLNVDASRVNLELALKDLPKLRKFRIRMAGPSTGPAFLLEYARQNPALREFVILIDGGGDPSNLRSGLEAIGFRAQSWGPGFLGVVR